MDAGKLRHRIRLQRYVQAENEHKITVGEWQDLKTVWADANYLKGQEFWDAKNYDAENSVEFVIRYFADLNLDDRIVFNGAIYNITSINNFGFRNKLLKILAVEVQS